MSRSIHKKVALSAVVIGLTAALSACNPAAPGGGGDGGDEVGTIRVGMVCGGMTPMSAMLAIDANTFPDDLTVEKVCFDGGSEGVQALIGRSVDVFTGSTEHILSTRAQGLSLRGYGSINNRAPYALLTRADSDVESVADLAGTTVAVTSPGSLSDTELAVAALENDVAYDDISVIAGGSGATMAAAIENADVSAGAVSDPQRSEMLDSGDFREIWTPDFEYAAIVMMADEEWVASNSATMDAFLTGLRDAAEKAAEDPDWAAEVLKEEGFPVSDDVLRLAVDANLEAIPDGLQVTEEVYDETTSTLVSVGALEEDAILPYEDVFDLSHLPGE